ncbi:16S rRNA (uracil(1498)-N(3))-methyltransferase [Arthrobacter sulfonylureivorans]|uniref:Ribosomal RNA small subunit methyltransferase E n=1 Tax=Arthrobacter sulfonylureivorans TaxID=2486855 RepID=A0ABY3W4S6_9MICC|nr:16S rRNA (uracil(1498)-N(3))-methyltransferase [Arthrobacter sulfonylureivorans]UNK44377.1 16S rRNA (uracil(1498)-N(3))-methyltransferase [Arthrobacter sulfonylureivorans]
MTSHLFFTAPGELDAAAPGDSFTLTGDEARHAVTVKRIEPGELVDLADGRGRRLVGEAVSGGSGELTVRALRILQEPEPDPELVLVQALAKGNRDELAIEAATELGVDTVVPWQAERSIVRWKADKAAKGTAKWQMAVRAAAKQSRRARVPEVEPLVERAGLCALIRSSRLSLLLHEGAQGGVADAVQRAGLGADRAEPRGNNDGGASPDGGASREGGDSRGSVASPSGDGTAARVLMIVGPEGGMSQAEMDAMLDAGAVAVRLGPHVLRSSTAGPAALTLLSEILGRWR